MAAFQPPRYWRQFPPVDLTEERLDAFHEVAHETLSRTINEFIKVDGKPVDPSRWRYMRSEGNLSVYYDRAPMHAQLPSLLIAGTLQASLEDVMEGLYADNSEDAWMAQRKICPRIVDVEVLQAIEKQSRGKPFTFTGLKWAMIKSSSSGMSTNRDLCYLEKLGTISISGGRKLGYFIMQSVDLPECPPAPSNKAIRAWASMCYLFEEIQDGTVGMYMRGTMDSQGPNILRKIARRSFADLSLSIAEAVSVAHAKRYAQLMRTKRRDSKQIQRSIVCELCECLPSFFDHHQQCAGCNKLSVCKRCRVKKSIFQRDEASSTRLARATFCLGCVTNVREATLPARDSEEHDSVREPSGDSGAGTSFTMSADDDQDDSQRSLRMFSLKLQRQLDDIGYNDLDASMRLTGLQSLGSGRTTQQFQCEDSDDDDDSVRSLDEDSPARGRSPDSTDDERQTVSDIQSIHLVRRSLQPPEMLEAQEFDHHGRLRRRPYANSYSESPAQHQHQQQQHQRQLLSRLVKASQQTLQLTREQTRIAQRQMDRTSSGAST